MQASRAANPHSGGAESTPRLRCWAGIHAYRKSVSVREGRQSLSMLITASMKIKSHCLHFVSWEHEKLLLQMKKSYSQLCTDVRAEDCTPVKQHLHFQSRALYNHAAVSPGQAAHWLLVPAAAWDSVGRGRVNMKGHLLRVARHPLSYCFPFLCSESLQTNTSAFHYKCINDSFSLAIY